MGFGADGAFYVADRTAQVIYCWTGDALQRFIPSLPGKLPDGPEFLLYVPNQ